MLTIKHNYRPIKRKTEAGVRHYMTPDGHPVPSVTTILDATKPPEKQKILEDWRKRHDARHGEGAAEAYTKEAADRGTKMHAYLEDWCKWDTITPPGRRGKPRDTMLSGQGYRMANVIIKHGLDKLEECWAVEAALYYTGLYAGTTDCVGVWNGQPCIVDFKQTNRPKKREWIDDYFLQLAAYANAHNHMFESSVIRSGVILMCSADLEYQEFRLEESEFDLWSERWFDRVEQYHLGS